MKNILYVLLLITYSIASNSQSISVESFVIANGDISASTQARCDSNGDACGLVKVFLPLSGAKFNGNVVGKPEQQTSTYWVYMSPGSKRLQIEHLDFPQLNIVFKDYGITSILGKTTYNLELNVSEKNVKKQILNIKVVPKDAVVQIDGETVDNGSIMLSVGTHRYNVAARGFYSQTGSIEITENSPAKLLVELDRKHVAEDSADTQYSTAKVGDNQEKSPTHLQTTTDDKRTKFLDSFQLNIEAVDLGLPSGTLWADRNLGASTILNIGYSYMWGDTSPNPQKLRFTDYKFYDKKNKTYEGILKYNSSKDKKTILDLEDDAASVLLGAEWHIPTNDEFNELLNCCYIEEFKGYCRLTGPNGKSIVMPDIPWTYNRETNGYGHYWTSSIGDYTPNASGIRSIALKNVEKDKYYRWVKGQIRAVKKTDNKYTYPFPTISIDKIEENKDVIIDGKIGNWYVVHTRIHSQIHPFCFKVWVNDKFYAEFNDFKYTIEKIKRIGENEYECQLTVSKNKISPNDKITVQVEVYGGQSGYTTCYYTEQPIIRNLP